LRSRRSAGSASAIDRGVARAARHGSVGSRDPSEDNAARRIERVEYRVGAAHPEAAAAPCCVRQRCNGGRCIVRSRSNGPRLRVAPVVAATEDRKYRGHGFNRADDGDRHLADATAQCGATAHPGAGRNDIASCPHRCRACIGRAHCRGRVARYRRTFRRTCSRAGDREGWRRCKTLVAFRRAGPSTGGRDGAFVSFPAICVTIAAIANAIVAAANVIAAVSDAIAAIPDAIPAAIAATPGAGSIAASANAAASSTVSTTTDAHRHRPGATHRRRAARRRGDAEPREGSEAATGEAQACARSRGRAALGGDQQRR